MLRFVSNAVMVGFINAVGVNIVLGQLANLTGYSSPHGSRLTRALDTLLHPGRLHGQSVAIGVATMVLIVLLERTPLGSLGLVVAVVVTSAAAMGLGWDVATVHDLGAELGTLPRPQFPDLTLVPSLLVPALSLALVGLVQGAGISANFPNPDGSYPDASRDFIGQGVANVASGVFQGHARGRVGVRLIAQQGGRGPHPGLARDRRGGDGRQSSSSLVGPSTTLPCPRWPVC